jgi:ATP-dependent RNA helicase RhlE
MHNNYRQNNHREYGNNFHVKRSSSNFRGRQVKKLDPSLFIKKAQEPEQSTELDSLARFSDYNIDEKLKRNIIDHGYKIPTSIQEQSMPQILMGRDIIGIANTGTGKTAAFLITLINKAFLDRNQRVLIVVPTRELAVQIKDEFKIFAKGTDLEAVAAIGGVSINGQTHALRHRPNFVIATPGRLKDLIDRREINLSIFQNVVLDEVDRMLDVGFLNDIKYIISFLPRVRQSLFFSATVDKRTEEIVRNFVVDPVTISVKKQETGENIEQDIIRVNGNVPKIDVLHDLLAKPEFEKVLIFGRTKWGMEKLSKTLIERGFRAAAIHGNKSQNQRQKALQEFKDGRLQVLLATDVASRGIDIENVSHVINFDAPQSYEEYVHRIGRTGRAGKPGIALTFVE